MDLIDHGCKDLIDHGCKDFIDHGCKSYLWCLYKEGCNFLFCQNCVYQFLIVFLCYFSLPLGMWNFHATYLRPNKTIYVFPVTLLKRKGWLVRSFIHFFLLFIWLVYLQSDMNLNFFTDSSSYLIYTMEFDFLDYDSVSYLNLNSTPSAPNKKIQPIIGYF